MRKKVILMFTAIAFLAVFALAQEAQKVFVLYFIIYRDNSIQFKDFTISRGSPSEFFDMESDYRIKIISLQEQVLFEKPLQVFFIAYGQIEDIGESHPEVIELNESVQYLKLPYFGNADRLEIYHLDEIIFSLDIKKYICQKDGICSGDENEINCPSDCKKVSSKSYYVIAIIVLVVLAGIIFFIKRRSTSKNEYPNLYSKWG